MQAEYATDIIFKHQKDLKPIYENISRTAIHAVKADNIATFLGRKLNGNFQGEMGNDFSTRIEGMSGDFKTTKGACSTLERCMQATSFSCLNT